MKKKKKYIIILLVFVAIVFILFYIKGKIIDKIFEEPKIEYREVESINTNFNVKSKQYILKSLENDQILIQKDADKQIPMASLTKLTTAILILEYAQDLQKKVTVDAKVINSLSAKGASLSGFKAGDKVTIEELLYGILLPSGGDAAILGAKYVSGSEKDFVIKMNSFATKLGLENTSYKNSTGLDQEGQYSTVRDLSKVLTYCINNKEFYKILTTLKYNTPPTPYMQKGYSLKSTVLEKGLDLNLENGKILGGKTGYTPDAGLCLASIAEVNGRLYILVTTGASTTNPKDALNVEDAIIIYNKINKVKEEMVEES